MERASPRRDQGAAAAEPASLERREAARPARMPNASVGDGEAEAVHGRPARRTTAQIEREQAEREEVLLQDARRRAAPPVLVERGVEELGKKVRDLGCTRASILDGNL